MANVVINFENKTAKSVEYWQDNKIKEVTANNEIIFANINPIDKNNTLPEQKQKMTHAIRTCLLSVENTN